MRVSREAVGVVAHISAWNYPYFVGLNVILPALLSGCPVLYKPSELATQSGVEMVRLLHEAGFARASVAAVVGDGAAGDALVRSALVDGVYFTGSSATGQKIAVACAERMPKMQFELGGKDPFYVHNDVNGANCAASYVQHY